MHLAPQKVLERLQKEKKQRAKEERLAKDAIDKLWKEEEDAELKKIEEAREIQLLAERRKKREEEGKDKSARLDAMRRETAARERRAQEQEEELMMLQSTQQNQARRIKEKGEAIMALTAQQESLAALEDENEWSIKEKQRDIAAAQTRNELQRDRIVKLQAELEGHQGEAVELASELQRMQDDLLSDERTKTASRGAGSGAGTGARAAPDAGDSRGEGGADSAVGEPHRGCGGVRCEQEGVGGAGHGAGGGAQDAQGAGED